MLGGLLLLGRDEAPAAKARQVGVVERRAPGGPQAGRDAARLGVPVAMSTIAGGRGLLVAADDGRIRVWDLNDGREVKTLDYGDAGLFSLDARRDGREIVAAGTLGVRTWSIAGLGSISPDRVDVSGPATSEQSDREARTVTGAAFAPDGFRLLIVRDGRGVLTSRFGDTEGRTVVQRAVRVDYSPRGTAILAVAPDGTARLRTMRASGFRAPARTGPERVLRAPGRIATAVFSADGSRIATASSDGVARLWRARDAGLLKQLRAGRAPLTDARLSPDGSLVATAGTDGVLRVMPAAGGPPVDVVRASLRPLTAVRWAASGQLLVTTGADGAVRVWANAAPRRPLPRRAQRLSSSCRRRRPSWEPAVATGGCTWLDRLRRAPGRSCRRTEAGTFSGACGRAERRRVALETADGRCWVFVGVAPKTGAHGEAGAPIGRSTALPAGCSGACASSCGTGPGGYRMSNLWNPMLFLDVRGRIPPVAGRHRVAGRRRGLDGRGRPAGLPPELPVMAGLVESGLQNLTYGDRDSLGLFQMRARRWNPGVYAGFPSRPDIQMQWFIDRARQMRARRGRHGRDPAGHPSEYGQWAADVTQPDPQYRGRFQLRLDEARQLLKLPDTGTASVEPGSGGGPPEPAAAPLAPPGTP